MPGKPRYVYEVERVDAEPLTDGSFLLLVETREDIDISLHLDRKTLLACRDQIAALLSERTQP